MAIVKKYKAEVVSLVNHFENIFTLEMTSKNGQFKYFPGQFLHLALDEYDPSLNWPESRCFSMQSSPNDELLKITFAVKGNFTNRMAQELNVGKTIYIKLPFGELFQQEHCKNDVVFIAGGTGITPFLSFFVDEKFKDYVNPKLYFGVREKKFNIYGVELEKAKKINPDFKIQMKYQDLSGILNINEIFEGNGTKSTYFISGPHQMISEFKKVLILNKVRMENIKTDEWE